MTGTSGTAGTSGTPGTPWYGGTLRYARVGAGTPKKNEAAPVDGPFPAGLVAANLTVDSFFLFQLVCVKR